MHTRQEYDINNSDLLGELRPSQARRRGFESLHPLHFLPYFSLYQRWRLRVCFYALFAKLKTGGHSNHVPLPYGVGRGILTTLQAR